MMQRSVQDQCAAHTRANRDKDHVCTILGYAELMFRKGHGIYIVIHRDAAGEGLFKRSGDV
jgi:hypothetical protein